MIFSRLKIFFALLGSLWSEVEARAYIRDQFPTCRVESNVKFLGDIKNLHLGKNVLIRSGSILHLGGYDWCDNKGHLEIGDNSIISFNCAVYGCGPGGLRIGKNSVLGPGVGVFAARTDYNAGPDDHIFDPVVIGDEVMVYANATISTGVTVGDRAAIAANAAVVDDVPPNMLVAGVPARVIKERGGQRLS